MIAEPSFRMGCLQRTPHVQPLPPSQSPVVQRPCRCCPCLAPACSPLELANAQSHPLVRKAAALRGSCWVVGHTSCQLISVHPFVSRLPVCGQTPYRGGNPRRLDCIGVRLGGTPHWSHSLTVLSPHPQGRFTIAAKHHISIAEIYETELVDVEKVNWYQAGCARTSGAPVPTRHDALLWHRKAGKAVLRHCSTLSSISVALFSCLPRPSPTTSSLQTTTKEKSPTGSPCPLPAPASPCPAPSCGTCYCPFMPPLPTAQPTSVC